MNRTMRRRRHQTDFKPYVGIELPVTLTVEESRWLLKLAQAPIRRDAPGDVPFAIATVLLSFDLIKRGVEFQRGPLANQTWRTWEITQKGRDHT